MSTSSVINIRDSDGYVNLTQLCRAGGKRYTNWIRNAKTTKFLELLSLKLNKHVSKLVEYVSNGSNGERHTYGHPQVATHLAQWISAEFAVNVSMWIEEWRTLHDNNTIYVDKLQNITGDFENEQEEKEVQLRLQAELGGEIEVPCADGYIDLLTSTEIIEVKEARRWKEALGQILIYSLDYPKHQKRIHLFNTIAASRNVEKKCGIYGVIVTYEL